MRSGRGYFAYTITANDDRHVADFLVDAMQDGYDTSGLAPIMCLLNDRGIRLAPKRNKTNPIQKLLGKIRDNAKRVAA